MVNCDNIFCLSVSFFFSFKNSVSISFWMLKIQMKWNCFFFFFFSSCPLGFDLFITVVLWKSCSTILVSLSVKDFPSFPFVGPISLTHKSTKPQMLHYNDVSLATCSSCLVGTFIKFSFLHYAINVYFMYKHKANILQITVSVILMEV